MAERRFWLAVCMLAAPTVAAQTQAPPIPSTRAGVYTAAQAERGRMTYAGLCRSCHTPASHTGVTFEKWWKGRTLGDLFGFMTAQMPKNDPGSLSPEQYTEVIAYLLKMNAMPVGKSELLPDSTVLATVLIELPHKPAKKAAPSQKTKTLPPPRKKGD
jgi:mono/diheme cytochrome c family protein